MAKKVKKDVEFGIEVTKKGNGAKAANRELKDLERGFKKTTRQAAKLTIKSAALEAKQKQLGRAVASGSMSVKKAAKEYQKFTDKLNKTAKATQGANAAQSKSKGILEVAKANWMALAGGVVAAGVAIKGAKELFDFAQEGAAVQQLEESFDRLNETTFKTPNLLEDMQDAVRGTVSPLKLMKGVMTLTAGASDEMAKEFAEASPKLAEIAKAAQKLNPTLGDTAFLYDSIAMGIKRSSPLILDNLGIVVKIGQANEDFAAILGKTVEEMTAMEKQQALLNATMKAGDQLIKQVGGDVSSGMDKYAQLTTAVDILKDGMKSLAADALGPVVEHFANLLIQAKEARELREITDTARDVSRDLLALLGVSDVEAAITEADRAFQDAWESFGSGGRGPLGAEFGLRILPFEKDMQKVFTDAFNQVMEDAPDLGFDEHVQRALRAMEIELFSVTDAAVNLQTNEEKVFGQMQRDLEETTIRAEQLEDRTKGVAEAMDATNAVNKDARIATRMDVELERELGDLKRINLGIQTEQREERAEAVELARELTEEEEKIQQEAEDAAQEIADLVAELEKAARIRWATGTTSALKEIVTASEAGEEVTTNLNNVMFESAVQGGVTGLAYLELARSTGLYTDEQIRAAIRTEAMKSKAEDLGRQIADNNISVGDAIQQLEDFNAELDRVPTKLGIDIELNLPNISQELQNIVSQQSATPERAESVELEEHGLISHGGQSGIVPGGFPNDSFPILAESGEKVLIQTKAQQRAGKDLHGNSVNGNQRGSTKIMHSQESNVFYVPDESTARFVEHQIDESRRQRYEDFMGKG